jgi:hypothetical protein
MIADGHAAAHVAVNAHAAEIADGEVGIKVGAVFKIDVPAAAFHEPAGEEKADAPAAPPRSAEAGSFIAKE